MGSIRIPVAGQPLRRPFGQAARTACALLAAWAAGGLHAQPAAQDMKQPTAAPPAFESAISGYRRFTDQPVADWKNTNDEVGRIGGWRAYAREASNAAAAGSPPAAPARGAAHHGAAHPATGPKP